MPNPPNPLRRLLGRKDNTGRGPVASPERAGEETPAATEARAYLERVRQKMERLAEDFAAGRVNATQFQELYAHYQQERQAIEEALEEAPEAAAWRAHVPAEEGESKIIRRRHAARILGYAIYVNASGTLVRSVGGYDLDDRLIAPILESVCASTAQDLESSMRSIEIENARQVRFIPGHYTTLAVVFSTEPARSQLNMLRDLQVHFERANEHLLSQGVTDAAKFVFPHATVFE